MAHLQLQPPLDAGEESEREDLGDLGDPGASGETGALADLNEPDALEEADVRGDERGGAAIVELRDDSSVELRDEPSVELRDDPGETAELPSPRKVTLYHFPTSLCSQRVRLALAEKGVVWDERTVNIGPAHEQYEPWYAKLNAKLVVPTLEVEGTLVTDSVEIVRFIDQAFPGPSLLPRDPAARDEVLAWVERQDRFPLQELSYGRAKGLVRWFERWTLGQRRKQLRKLQKKHPELRELYLAKLEQLELFAATVGDRALLDQIFIEVEDLLDEFEERLGEHEWLVGDSYTLADLVWTVTLARLDHIGFGRSLSERRRPRVADWYRRLRERSSWSVGIRRLSPRQMARFYGPAVLKTFAIAWVIKWAVLTPLIYWLASLLNCSGG